MKKVMKKSLCFVVLSAFLVGGTSVLAINGIAPAFLCPTPNQVCEWDGQPRVSLPTV